MNYFIQCDLYKYLSNLILYLYDEIENQNYHIYDNSIDFSTIKSNTFLYLFKIEFENIQEIHIKKDLEDDLLNKLSNLFSIKLNSLYLSNNKITDMTVFNQENIFGNLINLDLSYNNIININILTDCNFPNLEKLDLSHNEISNIECLKKDKLELSKLKTVNVSDNNIKCINKINIKSLCSLNLLNNNISSGINNFIDNFGNYENIQNEVIIENHINELLFNYTNKKYNNCFIKFLYVIEKDKRNRVLEEINFNKIEILLIKRFNNIDFLSNKSLNNLKQLDLQENDINDISIFNKIHF